MSDQAKNTPTLDRVTKETLLVQKRFFLRCMTGIIITYVIGMIVFVWLLHVYHPPLHISLMAVPLTLAGMFAWRYVDRRLDAINLKLEPEDSDTLEYD